MRSLLLALEKIITLKEDSYNEDLLQSADGTCLMKLFPRYSGDVPTTATNEQIEEAIDYFNTNFGTAKGLLTRHSSIFAFS